MLTKKLIEEAVRVYIAQQNHPASQVEARTKDFFDIKGIVNELYQKMLKYPKELLDGEVSMIVNHVLHNAETNANTFARWKVSTMDIAEGYNEYVLTNN